MGQGVVCAYKSIGEVLLKGIGHHPELIAKHGFPGDRSGWLCFEASLGRGPKEYDMSALGWLADGEEKDKVEKMVTEFFDSVTKDIPSLSRHVAKYGFHDEHLHVFNEAGRGTFDLLTKNLEHEADTKWAERSKNVEAKKTRKLQKEMELAAHALLAASNRRVTSGELRIPITMDRNIISHTLYEASARGIIAPDFVKHVEESFDAIVKFFEVQIEQVLKGAEDEKNEFFKREVVDKKVNMWRAVAGIEACIHERWLATAVDLSGYPEPKLHFRNGNDELVPISAKNGWAITDEYGYVLIGSYRGKKPSTFYLDNGNGVFSPDNKNGYKLFTVKSRY